MIRRTWDVEFTDEFAAWWSTLDRGQQAAVDARVRRLEVRGLALEFPYSSGIKGSAYGNMRELRVQRAGRPLRVLYAFDPRRVAILLIGGDKTGDSRFYDRTIAVADRLYADHLDALRREELI